MRPDFLCPDDEKSAKFAIIMKFKMMKNREILSKLFTNGLKTDKKHQQICRTSKTRQPPLNQYP
jgi:hypothetical protein